MRREIRELLEHGDHRAMGALVTVARANDLSDVDIADLARVLARSGAQLPRGRRTVDFASTGGPSSLSTLLCPLHLCVRGLLVAKLAVRGRPAGGIDVLETIPGFQSTLAPEAAAFALEKAGYVHLLAGEQWAPLDAALFAYRRRADAQAIPGLVIASILAKKLAVGVTGAGLEVRVAPHGNLAADMEEARRHAHRYNAVAALLELEPVCALTDASQPYQPYIGRGEALMALAAVLEGSPCEWLAEHAAICLRMSNALADVLGVDTAQPPDLPTMRRAQEKMLVAQGAEAAAFWRQVEAVRAAPRTTVSADRAGWIDYDLAVLREVLLERQNLVDGSDPAGVILLARPGTRVQHGDALMAVRGAVGHEKFALRVQACVQIVSAEVRRRPTPSSFEIVR